MKKTFKYTNALLIVLTLCVTILSSATSVSANTKKPSTPEEISITDFPDIHLSDLTPEQSRKLNLMFTIGEELALTDQGELYFKHNAEFIKNKYNLSNDVNSVNVIFSSLNFHNIFDNLYCPIRNWKF